MGADTCAACAFFVVTGEDKRRSTMNDKVSLGQCRRFPPASQHETQHGVWPIVSEVDLCGEHRAKAAASPDGAA